jgi:peptidyl-prolyl cis-trans isomerase C
MHNLSKLAAALLAATFLSTPALAAGNAFVTVNGVAVSQDLANAFIAEQTAQGTPVTPELKSAVREELIRRELLAQEAKKAGITKTPEIAAQADAARQAIFIRAYIQDYVQKNPISDDAIKAQYDKVKAQIEGTEYKARHILVASDEQAKAIIVELKNGAKFEELAKQSIDPGSKDNGGELDWANPNAFVKEFGEALKQLAKGTYTETPVQTQFGYHVILLEDSRDAAVPPLDEVKPQLMQRLQQQQIEAMINALRAKAKVQ